MSNVKTDNIKPNFIGIGSQRAGTTWLYNCLIEHPDIFMPSKKELHFFDLGYDKGIDWYLSNFATHNNEKMVGEITPNYYQHPQALERIAAFNKQVKIIYIVRNPIDRAHSHYKLFLQSHFKGKSFSEIIKTNKNIIDLGLQAKHLQRMYELFDHKNILTLLYDDLCANPELLLQSVYKFLEIDGDFKTSALHKRINRVVLPNLQSYLVKLKLNWLIVLVKKSFIAEPIKSWLSPKHYKNIEKSDKDYLQNIFASDIANLEQFINRDLSHWK